MNGKVPHLIQYQGSKRLLAPQILRYMPNHFTRLIEPFSGMAAISIAAAYEQRAEHYWINDINSTVISLLQMAVEEPQMLIDSYTEIWEEQFSYQSGSVKHFFQVRDLFNSGDKHSAKMLYLLARCVKGAVRYGKNGDFNQSPDKRRHGTNPQNIALNIFAISSLLQGKVTFSAMDYKDILYIAKPGDLIYMDPPYQGVSNTRDNRYISGVEFSDFCEAIAKLNEKNIDFVISYDGECGGKAYGEELPKELKCKKILLNAGPSTQATLLGRRNITYEALYISHRLSEEIPSAPKQVAIWEDVI